MKLYTYSEVCNKAVKQGKKITDLFEPVDALDGRKLWVLKQTKLVVKKIHNYQFN